MHSPAHAIVFDFDGTLADTAIDFDEMKARLVRLVLGFLPGFPPPNGGPALEWLAGAKNKLRSISPDLVPVLEARASEVIRGIEIEAAERGRLFPFTLDILKRLRTSGIGTAVITRNCRDAVTTVYPNIASDVDIVLTRDDVINVKPHPAHVRAALQHLGLGAEYAIMVGDHTLDIETGRCAGLMTAGVLTGNGSRDHFMQYGADMIATNAGELMDFLLTTGRLVPGPRNFLS